jgi:hypothetical protein
MPYHDNARDANVVTGKKANLDGLPQGWITKFLFDIQPMALTPSANQAVQRSANRNWAAHFTAIGTLAPTVLCFAWFQREGGEAVTFYPCLGRLALT